MLSLLLIVMGFSSFQCTYKYNVSDSVAQPTKSNKFFESVGVTPAHRVRMQQERCRRCGPPMWLYKERNSYQISFADRNVDGKYFFCLIPSPALSAHLLDISTVALSKGVRLKQTWQNQQHPEYLLHVFTTNDNLPQVTTLFAITPFKSKYNVADLSAERIPFQDIFKSLNIPSTNNDQDSLRLGELSRSMLAKDDWQMQMQRMHRTEVSKLESQLENKTVELAVAQSKLMYEQEQRNTMQQSLKSKEAEVNRLNSMIQEQNANIDELNQVQTLQTCHHEEVSRLEQGINAKDKEISLLQEEMKSMEDGFTRRSQLESMNSERQTNDEINDLKQDYESKMSHAKVIWIIITFLFVLATPLSLFGVFRIYNYCKKYRMEINLKRYQQRQDSMDMNFNPGADVGDVKPVPFDKWKSNQIPRNVNDIAARRASEASTMSDQLFNEEGNEFHRNSKSVDMLPTEERNHNLKEWRSLNKWENKEMTRKVSDICRNRDRSISSDLFGDVKTNSPPVTIMTHKSKSVNERKSQEMTKEFDDICRNRSKSESSDLFKNVTTKSGDETTLTFR